MNCKTKERPKVEMELDPFLTPSGTNIKRIPEKPTIFLFLNELDADDLSALCDEFRANIFAEAGKADPRCG